MAKTMAFGPNGTSVDGLASITLTSDPLNFDADFRIIDEGPGKVVMTDVTSPLDQPATLRVAQQSKPNVYAGSSIDPSAYIANKRGTDTIVEVREVWSITDDTDPTFLQLVPVRAAISLTLPSTNLVTADAVEQLVMRTVMSLYTQGAATMDAGLGNLLHGVVKKG